MTADVYDRYTSGRWAQLLDEKQDDVLVRKTWWLLCMQMYKWFIRFPPRSQVTAMHVCILILHFSSASLVSPPGLFSVCVYRWKSVSCTLLSHSSVIGNRCFPGSTHPDTNSNLLYLYSCIHSQNAKTQSKQAISAQMAYKYFTN